MFLSQTVFSVLLSRVITSEKNDFFVDGVSVAEERGGGGETLLEESCEGFHEVAILIMSEEGEQR